MPMLFTTLYLQASLLTNVDERLTLDASIFGSGGIGKVANPATVSTPYAINACR